MTMNTCDRDIVININRKTGECEFIDNPGFWNRCKLSKRVINEIMKLLKDNTSNLR